MASGGPCHDAHGGVAVIGGRVLLQFELVEHLFEGVHNFHTPHLKLEYAHAFK